MSKYKFLFKCLNISFIKSGTDEQVNPVIY
jgi:hypothetical protein